MKTSRQLSSKHIVCAQYLSPFECATVYHRLRGGYSFYHFLDAQQTLAVGLGFSYDMNVIFILIWLQKHVKRGELNNRIGPSWKETSSHGNRTPRSPGGEFRLAGRCASIRRGAVAQRRPVLRLCLWVELLKCPTKKVEMSPEVCTERSKSAKVDTHRARVAVALRPTTRCCGAPGRHVYGSVKKNSKARAPRLHWPLGQSTVWCGWRSPLRCTDMPMIWRSPVIVSCVVLGIIVCFQVDCATPWLLPVGWSAGLLVRDHNFQWSFSLTSLL